MKALQSQLAAAAAEADALREQAGSSQRQAVRDLEERLALELRQQQLKYEQRIQVGRVPGSWAAQLQVQLPGWLPPARGPAGPVLNALTPPPSPPWQDLELQLGGRSEPLPGALDGLLSGLDVLDRADASPTGRLRRMMQGHMSK
jgi:hypothetical protein